MKASREYKQWVNNMRSRYKKAHPNGVLPACFFDHPILESHENTSKRHYRFDDDIDYLEATDGNA